MSRVHAFKPMSESFVETLCECSWGTPCFGGLRPIFGLKEHRVVSTTDQADAVTCKHCLRLLATTPKEPRHD